MAACGEPLVDAFTSTLMEQGILGLFCAFLVYLHTSSDKRMLRLEEKRESDQRDLDVILDGIAAGVEELLRMAKEKLQDEKLEKIVRQGSRTPSKTKPDTR
jgi:hypothetical protein